MTRSALSTLAYEALVRARRKFSNREERCIRETWTAEQELVLLRLYPDMPNEVLAARLNKTLQQICSKAYRLGLKKSPEFSKKIRQDWGSATRFKKGQKPHTCSQSAARGSALMATCNERSRIPAIPPGLEGHPHPALGRTLRPHPNRPLRLLQGQQQAERRHRQPGAHHPGRTHAPQLHPSLST